MFYVFYVNQGYLQPIEVASALGSVHKLQCAIEELTHVPASEQVLLVSGGDGLQPDRPVAQYQGAGTDTNPIFLFCKLSAGELQEFNCPSENVELNELCTGFFDDLRSLDNLTISSALIGLYGEAARSSRNIADIAMQLCARLVQDHQLLHQGWLALVSNLDDSRSQIERRAERFYSHCERLKTMKIKAQTILQDFDSVLETLRRITVPASLLANSSKFEGGCKPSEECNLYEYISCADPLNSLKDMVDQAQLLLSKIDDTEQKQVMAQLKLVNDQINKTEVRDIRGINMRLTQLDTYLRSLEQHEKRLKEVASSISQTPPHDTSLIKETICKQREHMEEVKKIVEQLQKTCRAFSQSKIELLNNIRTRLSGWIVQAYERLHSVNNLIIIFEEKFFALRNRLDIIRQVKESPVMYATAITEAIRRSELQPEFHSWFTVYMDKITGLIREETSIRETFSSKLDRHFLKQLFPGMFDQFPDFAPSGIPAFDQNLPPVDSSHLRALRQAVPSLTHLLQVSVPSVYQRLMVRDPRASSTAQTVGAPAMRREESFFTSDAMMNVITLNKNFPSTNWLSGDENLEMSPSNALLLTKSPPSRFSSSLSLDAADNSSKPLVPLSPLFDATHQEGQTNADPSVSQSMKSAPIKIPHRTELNRQTSEKSSQFSTPEDHFGSHDRQLEADRRSRQTPLSDAITYLKPICSEVNRLSKDLQSVKELLVESKSGIDLKLKEALENVQNAVSCLEERNKTELKCEVESTRIEVEKKCEIHYEEIIKRLKGELDDGIARDRELEDLKEVLEEQQAEINALRSYKANTESAIARLENEKNELFKTLTIDHELELDRITSQYNDEIKFKEKEIESLKAALHKMKETRAHTQSFEEKTDDAVHKNEEIRAACEKEYKSKMQFLMKGLEERKADEIARVKKEAELDMRLKSKKYEEKIRELEQRIGDRLMFLRSPTSEDNEPSDDIHEEGYLEPSEATPTAILHENVLMFGHAGSVPSLSQKASETGDAEANKDRDKKAEVHEKEDSEGEDISAVTVNTAATQTRIRLKDMRVMITIQDIHEGCAVLVVWSEVHNSYILFSTSPVMHFVKESCLKRMGVKPDNQMPARRPNWLLATTARLEFCQIRKADNRYNLAIGTRFYRVEVDPLPLESSGLRGRRGDE